MSRGLRRVKPWANNILQMLDWADWKTWVWYSLLGVERLTNTLIVWMKRKTQCPAHVIYRDGRFYIVGERAWQRLNTSPGKARRPRREPRNRPRPTPSGPQPRFM